MTPVAAATLRTDRITLTVLSPGDARGIQDDHFPRQLFPGYALDQLRQSAQGLIDHPQSRTMFLIERGDDGVIGFIAVDRDLKVPDVTIISFIDIATALHNQRYGREALAAVMEWASERGARRLVAEIPPTNEPSRRLFGRAGFRRDDAARRPGAIERWVWPRDATADAGSHRERLQMLMSSPINHDDVLADVEPFCRGLANERTTAQRPSQHRLLQLVEAVEADRQAIREERATQNLPELVELRHVANTLKSWASDPRGRKLVGDIGDSTTFAHNILVLSAYGLLHSWENNRVELVPEQQGSPTCDLQVVVDAGIVASELKTPAEMREARHLTTDEAEAIAYRVIRGSREQRRSQSSFLLLVGGFQVPDTSLNLVATAIEKELEKSDTRSHVIGAVALTVGRHSDDIPLTVRSDTPLAGVYAQFAARLNPDLFKMGVAARIARNRRYDGPVRVLRYREPGVGLHLP